jgi:hypothetical protein
VPKWTSVACGLFKCAANGTQSFDGQSLHGSREKISPRVPFWAAKPVLIAFTDFGFAREWRQGNRKVAGSRNLDSICCAGEGAVLAPLRENRGFVGAQVLRPPKRGSLHIDLQTCPDFAVALRMEACFYRNRGFWWYCEPHPMKGKDRSRSEHRPGRQKMPVRSGLDKPSSSLLKSINSS